MKHAEKTSETPFVNILKALILGTALCSLLGLSACGRKKQAPSDSILDVALITNGPLTDWGFNQAHQESLNQAKVALGDSVSVRALGSVPETGDAERIMRRLIGTGANVIIAASFGYQDSTVKLAKEFPDVKFLQAWGFMPAENLGTFSSKMYEAWYVMGVVAASMSESGKLGVVAAHPIPPMKWQINAYVLGARSVKPDITASVAFINHWFDPGLAADAADSLISQGCDVLTGVLDNSVAVAQTAERRGVMLIGHNTDLARFAPKSILVGTRWQWGQLYADEIGKMTGGTWSGKSGDAHGGFAEGYVGITEFSERVPANVRQRANEAIERIKKGELQVYAGPIRDNQGKVVVAEGQVLSHGEIMGMDWTVEGVN
jgi:basic membrane protein A and related proteins